MLKPPLALILPQIRQQGKSVAVLWLLAAAGLLTYVAFTLQLCLLAIAYPYQLDYGEGLVLYQARLLSQGQSIYKAIDTFPYVFSNYPPFFQTLMAPFVALLGPSFLPGRVLALASTLGLAVVLYRLARLAGSGALAAAVAAVLFVGSPYIYHWAPLVRIDLPALFFSALGILVLASRRKEMPAHVKTMEVAQRSLFFSGQGHVWLAGLLFALGLYTKQSYLAAPAAAIVFLACSDRRALGHLLLSLLVFAALPFVAIDIATQGWFAFGLFTANVNQFSLTLLLAQAGDFVKTFAPVFVMAGLGFTVRLASPPGSSAAGLAAQGWTGRPGAALRRFSLQECYGLAALSTVLLAGKVGAWENYFFEALFMLCVFAALGLHRLMTTGPSLFVAAAPFLILVQLALMWHDPRIGLQVMAQDGPANRALAPLIARQTGMILSEDLGLLVLNGKDVPYFSFEYAQLAGVGKWDQTWETGALREGRFALVILEKVTREDPDRYRRFTREVLSALDASYGLVGEIGKYRIYAPLPLQRQKDVGFGGAVNLLGYRLDAADRLNIAQLGVGPASGDLILNPYPEHLRLTLLWQAQQMMATSYKVFVHLETMAGDLVAQTDSLPLSGLYPTNRWAKGETVRDYIDLELPPGLAPGSYILQVGLYDAINGDRLPLADGSTSLRLASLPLDLPAPPAVQSGMRFANGLTLVHSAVSARAIRAGSPLTVTLTWQTDRLIDRDYTIFLHLVGASGAPLAQTDGQPLDGAYPTSIWNPGELITDTHVIETRSDLPPGLYNIQAGLYLQPENVRLPVAGGGDSLTISDVTISAP